MKIVTNRSCPRCGGQFIPETQPEGVDLTCLQCGRVVTVERVDRDTRARINRNLSSPALLTLEVETSGRKPRHAGATI